MKRFYFSVLLALSVTAMQAQIVIDTDSGYFSDDGVAVTMLLRSARRAEVRGITVVSGNVWSRDGAVYMSRNVKLLGVPELPVLLGSEAPLIHTVAMRKSEANIAFAGAFDMPLPAAAQPKRGGVDFLIQTVEAAPGRVTILAIGPLTNLAIALRLRPDLAAKIQSLVMMGGNVHAAGNASPAAEFNFWFDPEAAQTVLRSEIPNKVLFALDVCNKVHLTKKIFDEVVAVKTPITDLYREDFGNRFPGFLKNQRAETALWDELAAAYLIDPKLVNQSESLLLDVETAFGPKYGAVKPLSKEFASAATPVMVVLDMDFERVFSMYKTALTAR
jgi:inosine-uridine nucleoside N-ribohydrolase